jgi:hypothetical protein
MDINAFFIINHLELAPQSGVDVAKLDFAAIY